MRGYAIAPIGYQHSPARLVERQQGFAGAIVRNVGAWTSQPFGFNREDVQLIRMPREGWACTCNEWVSRAQAKRFNDLADRIEALLPPE